MRTHGGIQLGFADFSAQTGNNIAAFVQNQGKRQAAQLIARCAHQVQRATVGQQHRVANIELLDKLRTATLSSMATPTTASGAAP